jgi:glycosyltransferase involved in cell wall biosynthesis
MSSERNRQDMVKADNEGGRCELSVVVPLLDEQENLRPLYSQITQALDGRYNYEVIFIDDGSTDGSFAVLQELHGSDARVRVIRFRKNFGQTAALSAGFAHARGDVVIAMDADLQNDPADIPMLVAKLGEGYDVVSGWRQKRYDKALTRRLPSKMANWLISTVTEVHLHDYGCTAICTASSRPWRAGAEPRSPNAWSTIGRARRARPNTAWAGWARSCWT